MSIQADSKAFAGKRVLVSGGTKGLGRATVDRFLAGGARVITSARSNPDPIDGVEFVQADLTTAAGGEALAKAALDRLGGRRYSRPCDGRFRRTGRRLRRPDGRSLAVGTEPEPSGGGPP